MRHGKARLCRAECPPHFLFVLPKRKPSRGASLAPSGQFTFRAGHGTKEKTLRDDLTRRCQITQNGGLAVTHFRPNLKRPYRLRYTRSVQRTASPASAGTAHTGLQIGRPLLLFPLPLPRPTPGGVSKGEGPQSRPFVSFQGGAGGNRNPPAFLFRGAGGDILFSKENIPLGFSPRKPGPPFVGAEKPDRPLR